MFKAGVTVELCIDPTGGHGIQTGFHDPPGGDAVCVSHTYESGRVFRRIFVQAGILYDDGTGPGQIVPAESCRTIASQPSCHPRPRRSAPQGVAAGVYSEFADMVKNENNRLGKILAGSLGPGAVNRCKGIVAMSGQLQRVGKAVVHSPHIGESTAGVAHSESGIRFTPEKEQTCILLVRVCAFSSAV